MSTIHKSAVTDSVVEKNDEIKKKKKKNLFNGTATGKLHFPDFVWKVCPKF